MMKNIIPIMHSYLTHSHRVPMWTAENDYEVGIAPNHRRMFTNDTLPDRIATAISMINAYPTRDYAEWELNTINVYINHQDPALDEIGWRINRNMYMLVLPTVFLENMANGRYT